MARYLFIFFSYKKKYNFKGGLNNLALKNKSNDLPLKPNTLPDKFYIYITNNIFNIKLRVQIHEKVLRGQPLIFGDDDNVPIHAPTSGWIEDISFIAHPINKHKRNIKIIISPDYLDKWIKLKPIKNYKKYTSEQLIKIIYQSGIVGLGGGEFSSAKKLILSINKAHTLIVNAVESEPDVTADNCLINNYMHEILRGCKIIAWIVKIKIVLIAVQEDKHQEISNIHSLIKNDVLFKICILKNKYPAGSSKVLVKALTGKEIPYGKHSIDIGYLVFNIATIYAIKRSIINGEPLTERIVSCIGDKNFFSGNFWIRIGTPIKYFLHDKNVNIFYNIVVCLGGVFMGQRIYNIDDSILKKTNCISVQFKKEDKKIIEYACIRCGYCSDVCPVNLLPQQLYWYSKNKNHKQTKNHYIFDCIECKACEKICPSYIPLVTYFQQEKKILYNINLEDNRKRLSFIRFQMREKRLLNQKKVIKNKSLDLIEKNNLDSFQKKYDDLHFIKTNKRKKMVEEAIKRVKSKK